MATTANRKLDNQVKPVGENANDHAPSRVASPRDEVLPRPHLWTKKQYHKMAKMGWFEGQRVELIEGEIIEMTAMNTPHWTAILLADEALRRAFGEGYLIAVQLPFDAGDNSEPEPDVAVIKGAPRDFAGGLPKSPLLVVEVSDTTLAFDRTRKAAMYARAGIEEYCIVNLKKRQLEVHRAPSDNGYADIKIVKSKELVSPVAAPQASVKVADLLP